jgi:hypothetical protein
MGQLHNGFNILVHGYGSKKVLLFLMIHPLLSRQALLMDFAHSQYKGPCVVINGYFPALSIKQVRYVLRNCFVSLYINRFSRTSQSSFFSAVRPSRVCRTTLS